MKKTAAVLMIAGAICLSACAQKEEPLLEMERVGRQTQKIVETEEEKKPAETERKTEETSETDETESSEKETQTIGNVRYFDYTNALMGYDIRYPDNWGLTKDALMPELAKPTATDYSDCFASTVDYGDYATLYSVGTGAALPPEGLPDVVNSMISSIKSQGLEVSEPEECKVDGYYAQMFQYISGEVCITSYMVDLNRKEYPCIATFSFYDTYGDSTVLEEFISSINFFEPDPAAQEATETSTSEEEEALQ